MKWFVLLAVFAVAAHNVASEMAGNSEMKESFAELTQATNKFAVDLYLALRNSFENIVVSPIGLQILLAMLKQGAKGDTADEIAKVIHQPQDNENVLKSYEHMIKGLQNQFLKLATKIFVEKTVKIFSGYEQITHNHFLAEANPINFRENPSGSRKEINDWASVNTNDKIRDLLSEDSVTDQTVLILANAIHFKADWNKKFNEKLTSDQPFYITPDNSVPVKMMNMGEEQLGYAESKKLNAQLVQLSYVGNEFSMVIILPKKQDGLSELESKLASLDLCEELSYIRKEKVNLQMPRFKIEQSMDLKKILIEMGMSTPFTGKADFSGISDYPLEISDVVQKAFIEVNEEGTEAAAATGIRSKRHFLICYEVNCNHPFLYAVMKQRDILFLGRVSNPSKE